MPMSTIALVFLHDVTRAFPEFGADLTSAFLAMLIVMEVLGHSTIALTANTYGHIERGMIIEAASRMDALLTGENATK